MFETTETLRGATDVYLFCARIKFALLPAGSLKAGVCLSPFMMQQGESVHESSTSTTNTSTREDGTHTSNAQAHNMPESGLPQGGSYLGIGWGECYLGCTQGQAPAIARSSVTPLE